MAGRMLRNSEIEALRKEAELANWRAEQAQNQLNTAQATAAEYADLYRDALRDGVTIDALQKRNESLEKRNTDCWRWYAKETKRAEEFSDSNKLWSKAYKSLQEQVDDLQAKAKIQEEQYVELANGCAKLARAYRKLRISYDRILNKIWFRKNKTRWRRTDNAMA
jgi:hypothetical protein